MQSENTHEAKQEVTIGREAQYMAIISEEMMVLDRRK